MITLSSETDEVSKGSEVNLFGLRFADFFSGTDFHFQMGLWYLLFVHCFVTFEIRIHELGCFQ